MNQLNDNVLIQFNLNKPGQFNCTCVCGRNIVINNYNTETTYKYINIEDMEKNLNKINNKMEIIKYQEILNNRLKELINRTDYSDWGDDE